MAKIERFISSGKEPGPSGISVPSSGFRQVRGESGLGDIGKVLTNTGINIKKRYEDAEKASQLSSLKVKTIRQFADWEKEYNNRTDYQNFGDRAAKMAKFKNEIQGQITFQDVSDSFMPYFEGNSTRFDLNIDALSRDKFVNADKVSVGNEMDNLVEVSTGMTKEKIMSDIFPLLTSGVAGRESSGVLNSIQADVLSKETAARIWDLHIDNLIDTNSPTIQAELEDDKNFPGLTPERREYWQDISAKQAAHDEKARENLKVRDVYDAVSIKYPDPDEAIKFLLKPGNAKKLDMSSDQMNKVVKIIKDQRAELKLAADNAKTTIDLAAKTKEKNIKKEKERMQGEISNNIFEFRVNNDDAGELDYIKSLPPEFGKEKKALLKEYETSLKPGADIKTDPVVLSDAQDAVDFAISQGKPIESGVLINTYGKDLSVTDQKALVKYNKDSQQENTKNAVSFQKSRVKGMYDRGDFGDLTHKVAKGKASKQKADILLGLNEWIMENPTKDPAEYVDSKINLIAEEEANKNINFWWGEILTKAQEIIPELEPLIPADIKIREAKENIADPANDPELAKRFVRDQGFDINDFSEDEINNISNTVEFNKFKTDLLRE